MKLKRGKGKSVARVLFVCKRRQAYGGYSGKSSGLFNSATFVADMLNAVGIAAKVVQVVDNNSIDAEVTEFAPTHAFIEALWVVPEKFDVLKRLHSTVKWIVRLHSNIPFIATEGIFVEWVRGYAERDVEVNTNSPEMQKALAVLGVEASYLPNFYPVNLDFEQAPNTDPFVLDVGCFGAIRPLKNQLIQAIAARRFADEALTPMRFHINASRVEGQGEPVLKNLRALFSVGPHTLVEHGWSSHDSFLELVRTMDVCMQVSFSETFNITAADAVSENVPVVASPEVPWISPFLAANPTDIEDIVCKLHRALVAIQFRDFNKVRLIRYVKASRKLWRRYF